MDPLLQTVALYVIGVIALMILTGVFIYTAVYFAGQANEEQDSSKKRVYDYSVSVFILAAVIGCFAIIITGFNTKGKYDEWSKASEASQS